VRAEDLKYRVKVGILVAILVTIVAVLAWVFWGVAGVRADAVASE